jgi:UDP-glucose 4-epimerase
VNLYAGKHVLVTGGLGFIGSNLAIRLVQLGAKVSVVDSCVRDCGSNIRNLGTYAGDLDLVEADIADSNRIRHHIKAAEVVFNLAGEVSHTHSMEFPERDLELNTRSQLAFLHQCTREAPGVRVVYASTRQIYGKPKYLPVDEAHAIEPVDVNGVSKHAAGMYHVMFSLSGLLDAVVLRLTNTYGPRLALNIPCQGVLSNFFLKILLNRPIEVFGDGTQLRDPVFVDDVVEAFLQAGAAPKLKSRVYNVGGPQGLSIAEIAGILCRLGGGSIPVLHPFPRERSRIDIGSFISNSSLIRKELGWQSSTSFEDGAARTLEFFRARLSDYIDPANCHPQCGLKQPLTFERKMVSAS